jgi:hypothetical protein
MRVSMDEYFRSTYGSLTEYIDGETVTKDGSPVLALGIGIDHADSSEHGEVQMLLASWFFASKDPWIVIGALRPEIEVLPNLSRMPDVALLQRRSSPEEEDRPPLLVVEILSNENFSILAGIVHEYLDAGIQTVWLIDPRLRTARWCTKEGWFKVAAHGKLRLSGSPIYVDLESQSQTGQASARH